MHIGCIGGCARAAKWRRDAYFGRFGVGSWADAHRLHRRVRQSGHMPPMMQATFIAA
jgi:hypothetical protein